MKKIIILLMLIIPFLGFSQTNQSVETTVPTWYGDRQIKPYDESETMQIIPNLNDTAYIFTTNPIYIHNLLNAGSGQQDLTSNNLLVWDWTKESYNITTIAYELLLLNRTNCIEGRKFILTIPTGGRIRHNYTASGNYRPFILNGSADINAIEKTSIVFVAYDQDGDNITDVYREVGRSSGAETDPPPTTVQFTIQVSEDNITAAGGTLTLSPSVGFTTGTVKLYDGKGNSYNLTSSITQDIDFVVADLDGESEKDFTWTFEITDATANIGFTLNNCYVKEVGNLKELVNLQNLYLQNSKLQGEFKFTDYLPLSVTAVRLDDCDSLAVINASEMINLTNLYGTSLGGLAELVALNIKNTKITELKTEGCLKLEQVDLSGVKLTLWWSSFSGLNPLLRYENVTNFENQNALVDFRADGALFNNFKNNFSIDYAMIPATATILALGGSGLVGQLDITKITSLVGFYADGNAGLTEIIADGLVNLTEISGANGNINIGGLTKISFNGCIAFKGNFWSNISFANNNISYVDITSCITLPYINLDNNNLNGGTMTGISTCTALGQIILTNNSLSQGEVDQVIADIKTAGKSTGTRVLTITTGNTGDPTLSPDYAYITATLGWTVN